MDAAVCTLAGPAAGTLFAPKWVLPPLPRLLPMKGNPAACASPPTWCGREKVKKRRARLWRSTRSVVVARELLADSNPGHR
jgi:hypothetical protein